MPNTRFRLNFVMYIAEGFEYHFSYINTENDVIQSTTANQGNTRIVRLKESLLPAISTPYSVVIYCQYNKSVVNVI